MNKKILTVGICMVIGVALLFTTAFANMADTTGYETYKSAIINTMKVKSFTGNVEMSVKDNGNTLMSAKGLSKHDHEGTATSSKFEVKSGSEERTIEMYGDGKRSIFKTNDSEQYNVVDFDKKHRQYRRHSEETCPEGLETAEKIMDALVGDLKNYVAAAPGNDGGSTVKVQLSGSQIPVLVNTVVSLAVKDSGRRVEHARHPFSFDIKPEMPRLVDEIRVSEINLYAEINKENFIEKQSMEIKINGKDAAGSNHEVLVDMNFSLSGINSTSPDTIDLTGKQVNIIKPEELRDRD